MKFKKIFPLLVLSTLLPLSAVHADVTPSGVHWASSSVNWYHNNSTLSSTWRSLIKSGRSAWTGTGASISYTAVGDTSKTAAVDNRNVWYAQNMGSGAVASTYVSYNGATNEINDIDTVMNTYYSWSTSGAAGAYDVQNIATHEWGHWVHLYDDAWYEYWDADNTMFGTSGTGETKKQTLTSEDSAAILSVYP